MNKIQLNYALERLKGVCNTRLAEVTAKYPSPDKHLTIKDVVDGIKSGKIKVKRDQDGQYDKFTYIENIFDVSAILPKEASNAERLKHTNTVTKAQAPIMEEYNRIKDQLILGDASEALKLIEAFSAKKF